MSSLPNLVIRRRSRAERAGETFSKGPWTEEERLLFLKGLRRFGTGRWKEIGTVVTTRSNRQISSHAQKIIERQKQGLNVFAELEYAEATNTAPPTPPTPSYVVTADLPIAGGEPFCVTPVLSDEDWGARALLELKASGGKIESTTDTSSS